MYKLIYQCESVIEKSITISLIIVYNTLYSHRAKTHAYYLLELAHVVTNHPENYWRLSFPLQRFGKQKDDGARIM